MRVRLRIIISSIATIAAVAAMFGARPASAARMIGYWASWARMPLSQTSSNYDVIDLAFGTPGTDGATITFTHNTGTETDAQLAADVQTFHSQGKKVILSIGGATATNLALIDATHIANFENSVESIINTYGLDGIDLDLENGAMNLNAGDNDIFNPTTPTTVNLITACHDLRNHYGAGFVLTMAPQTADIDGYGQYGTISGIGWGDYLPLIYGVRDMLTFEATQDYNSGTMYGPDGKIYTCGTQDFDSAVTELLLAGYRVANGQTFPALQPGQVAFGVPATSGSAHTGYLAPSSVLAVAKYIGSGIGYGGTYILRNPSGYPGFAGVMDWDINDDAGAGYAMANTLAPYLHSISGSAAPSVPTGLTATAGNTQVALSWNPSAGATSYKIFRSTTSGGEGTTAYATSTSASYTDTGVTNGTTYYYTVAAVNANGQSAQSTEVKATPDVPPAAPSNLSATAASASQVNLTWTNNATNVTGNEIWRSTDNVNFTQIANVAAAATSYSDTTTVKLTTYYYKVNAYNANTFSAYSNTASVTTPRR